MCQEIIKISRESQDSNCAHVFNRVYLHVLKRLTCIFSIRTTCTSFSIILISINIDFCKKFVAGYTSLRSRKVFSPFSMQLIMNLLNSSAYRTCSYVPQKHRALCAWERKRARSHETYHMHNHPHICTYVLPTHMHSPHVWGR